MAYAALLTVTVRLARHMSFNAVVRRRHRRVGVSSATPMLHRPAARSTRGWYAGIIFRRGAMPRRFPLSRPDG